MGIGELGLVWWIWAGLLGTGGFGLIWWIWAGLVGIGGWFDGNCFAGCFSYSYFIHLETLGYKTFSRKF